MAHLRHRLFVFLDLTVSFIALRMCSTLYTKRHVVVLAALVGEIFALVRLTVAFVISKRFARKICAKANKCQTRQKYELSKKKRA